MLWEPQLQQIWLEWIRMTHEFHGDEREQEARHVLPTFNRRELGVRERKNSLVEHPAVSKCSSSTSYIIDRALGFTSNPPRRKNIMFTLLSSTAPRVRDRSRKYIHVWSALIARTTARITANRPQGVDREKKKNRRSRYREVSVYARNPREEPKAIDLFARSKLCSLLDVLIIAYASVPIPYANHRTAERHIYLRLVEAERRLIRLVVLRAVASRGGQKICTGRRSAYLWYKSADKCFQVITQKNQPVIDSKGKHLLRFT